MRIVEILLQGTHVLVPCHLDDLVHRLARGHRRGDEASAQAMTTDIEIVDDLAGSPLDHQVDALRAQGIYGELPPAGHAAKQRALVYAARFQPAAEGGYRAILLAGNERDFGFMELMLARLEPKPDPLPHEVEIAHLDTSCF